MLRTPALTSVRSNRFWARRHYSNRQNQPSTTALVFWGFVGTVFVSVGALLFVAVATIVYVALSIDGALSEKEKAPKP